MIIARIIRKWFRPQDDFAAFEDQLRQLHAGKIDRLELPPGVRYQLLLPECPKCGYRAEPGADDGKGDAQDGRAPRMSGDLASPDVGVARNDLSSARVVAPLAEAEGAEARQGHRGIFPASGNAGEEARSTHSRHAVPPLHVFIDRIHRRIMGGKSAAAQGESA